MYNDTYKLTNGKRVIHYDKVAAELKKYDEVAQSIDESLAKLGLDYIDLLIIHSPQPWKEFREEKRYFL